MNHVSRTRSVLLLLLALALAGSMQAAPSEARAVTPSDAPTSAARVATADLVTARLVRAVNRRQPGRALRFATRPVVRQLMATRRAGYRLGGLRANPCGHYGSPRGWDCPATVFRGSRTMGTAYLWGSYRNGSFKIRRAAVALGE